MKIVIVDNKVTCKPVYIYYIKYTMLLILDRRQNSRVLLLEFSEGDSKRRKRELTRTKARKAWMITREPHTPVRREKNLSPKSHSPFSCSL